MTAVPSHRTNDHDGGISPHGVNPVKVAKLFTMLYLNQLSSVTNFLAQASSKVWSAKGDFVAEVHKIFRPYNGVLHAFICKTTP